MNIPFNLVLFFSLGYCSDGLIMSKKKKKHHCSISISISITMQRQASRFSAYIYLAIGSGRPFMSMEGRCVYVVCSGME